MRFVQLAALGLCLLALPQRGPAQVGFIRHYAAVQNGYGGWVSAVREVADGYLFFGDQVVAVDGEYPTHAVVWKVNGAGDVVSIADQFPGNPRWSTFGIWDAVERLPNGQFAAPIIDNGLNYDQRIMIHLYNEQGDTVQTFVPIAGTTSDSSILVMRNLVRMQDGHYLIAGAVDSLPNELDTNPMLAKVSPTGELLWMKEYPVPGQLQSAVDAEEYPDGGAVVFGYRGAVGSDNKNFVLRVDSAGNMLWRRYMGYRGPGSYGATAVDGNGDILTWSVYAEPEWDTYDWKLQLIKRDPAGYIIWDSRTHFNYISSTYDMYVLPNGDIIASANVNDQGTICKFSTDGDSLWTRTYSMFTYSAEHYLFDVEPTADGGIVAAGEVSQGGDDPEPGLQTLWMIRMDSMGCVVPGCHTVGVAEYEMALQEKLAVQPNPANEQVEFSLPLPAGYRLEGAVQAVVLDAQGKEVLRQPISTTTVEVRSTVDVSALPAGLYYLHLRDDAKWLAGSKVVVE